MIETPEAVECSELLAAEVDFFSIGTNDLMRYVAEIGQSDKKKDKFGSPYCERILSQVKKTVQNAHRAGISVEICGELASDPKMLEEYVNLGVDELSMIPENILSVRMQIREME